MKRIHRVLIYLFNFLVCPARIAAYSLQPAQQASKRGRRQGEREKGRGIEERGKGTLPSLFPAFALFSLPLPFLHLPRRLNLLMPAFYHLMIQSIQTHRSSAASSFLPFNISQLTQARIHFWVRVVAKEAFTRQRSVRTQNMAHVTGKTKR